MTGFWTRRRAAVAEEARQEDAALRAAEVAEAEAALEARTDEELLAELGLPAPEAVTPGEELRAFLAAELPQRLKRRALRKLWVSNPVLACLDGLNDYEDDFTDAAVVKEGMQTLYQVGRGFAERVEAVAEKIAPETPADEEAVPVADASVRLSAAPEAEMPPVVAQVEPAEELPADPLPPRFRRMQFQFDTQSQTRETLA